VKSLDVKPVAKEMSRNYKSRRMSVLANTFRPFYKASLNFIFCVNFKITEIAS